MNEAVWNALKVYGIVRASHSTQIKFGKGAETSWIRIEPCVQLRDAVFLDVERIGAFTYMGGA